MVLESSLNPDNRRMSLEIFFSFVRFVSTLNQNWLSSLFVLFFWRKNIIIFLSLCFLFPCWLVCVVWNCVCDFEPSSSNRQTNEWVNHLLVSQPTNHPVIQPSNKMNEFFFYFGFVLFLGGIPSVEQFIFCYDKFVSHSK